MRGSFFFWLICYSIASAALPTEGQARRHQAVQQTPKNDPGVASPTYVYPYPCKEPGNDQREANCIAKEAVQASREAVKETDRANSLTLLGIFISIVSTGALIVTLIFNMRALSSSAKAAEAAERGALSNEAAVRYSLADRRPWITFEPNIAYLECKNNRIYARGTCLIKNIGKSVARLYAEEHIGIYQLRQRDVTSEIVKNLAHKGLVIFLAPGQEFSKDFTIAYNLKSDEQFGSRAGTLMLAAVYENIDKSRCAICSSYSLFIYDPAIPGMKYPPHSGQNYPKDNQKIAIEFNPYDSFAE